MPGGASPPRSASIPSEDSLDSSVSTPASTPTMPQTPPTLNPYVPLGPMEGESCTGFPIEYFLEPPLPGATTANLDSPAFSDEDIKRPFSDLQLSPYDWPNESFQLNSHLLEQEAIPPYPLYYEQPLPREQREAYYQCLAEAVGPAIGVQESVGTYRTYMSQLGQRYYDRQFPQPNAAPTPTAVPEIHPQAILQYLSRGNHPTDQPRHISQRRESVDSSRPLSPKSAMEYHKWINSRVQTTSHIPSPAGPPPVPTPGNHPHRAEDRGFWSQFQTSQNQDVEFSNSLRLKDILESPVLRSRNSSCNVGNPGEGDILQYPGSVVISPSDIQGLPP
ncbi:hypothetical protein C8Q75DRAFT_445132 [Abortiporus biennis]|nr:hypothetical protein C8Q75DRAFT_445132 [Abortiporus biennis]